jgi:hypothetical protein
MESEFTKNIYGKINGTPWQLQFAKFVFRQKNPGYTVISMFILYPGNFLIFSFAIPNVNPHTRNSRSSVLNETH